MAQPELFITPRRPALLAGFANEIDVLIRLRAPIQAASHLERTPLNIALVLDRSGSMSGRPLEEAKRSACAVIDRLGSKDRVSVVVYDDVVTVLVPSTKVTARSEIKQAIRHVESGGTTNLHEGWLKGAEQVSKQLAPDLLSRVILLSDGQANSGLTDVAGIVEQCAALAREGVSTSTYGLGESFNEDLMLQMAQAGQGNGYYGRTAQDLMDPFQEEFDLLSALCARRVRLTLSTAKEYSLEVLNQFVRDDTGAYCLPDLAFEGEAWAVARISIPKAFSGEGDGHSVQRILSVMATYQDLDGIPGEPLIGSLDLPSLPGSAFSAVAEDPLVVARSAELEAAKIQDEAILAAREGDWPRVERLLTKARQNAGHNEWLNGVVLTLEKLARARDQEMFSKSASYTNRKMRSRLSGMDDSNLDAPAARYLRRKTEQGKGESEKN